MKARLTDGQHDYKECDVKDVDALDDLNKKAFEMTDGNLYWYSVQGLPRIPATDKLA